MGIKTLKISFLSNPKNFSSLDTNSWVFAYLLINISSLLNIPLTWFKYISCCLWLYLANNKGIKGTDRVTYIMVISIKNIYTGNTIIGNTYTIGS